MSPDDIGNALAFLRDAERLKDVLRSSHTSTGRPESTAEHTWRLCLMAMVFAGAIPGIDMARLLKICVVHDLGEAIHGDVPAVMQDGGPDKSARERADLETLTMPLPAAIRGEILALWEDYESAASPEAKLAKAFDKLETILQHLQGVNPPDFDYAFDLDYGARYTAVHPIAAALRAMIDEETRARVAEPSPGA
jgi:putative hydrolase of HD superfamily